MQKYALIALMMAMGFGCPRKQPDVFMPPPLEITRERYAGDIPLRFTNVSKEDACSVFLVSAEDEREINRKPKNFLPAGDRIPVRPTLEGPVTFREIKVRPGTYTITVVSCRDAKVRRGEVTNVVIDGPTEMILLEPGRRSPGSRLRKRPDQYTSIDIGFYAPERLSLPPPTQSSPRPSSGPAVEDKPEQCKPDGATVDGSWECCSKGARNKKCGEGFTGCGHVCCTGADCNR